MSLKDGKKLIIAEDIRLFISTDKTSSGSSFTHYHYNYKDIYVLVLDEDGQWIKTIEVNKNQHTEDDNAQFNSFTPIINDKELIFIYNGNRKDPKDIMYNTEKATVYITNIDLSDYEQTTSQLFNTKEFRIVATPKYVFIDSEKKSLILTWERQ